MATSKILQELAAKQAIEDQMARYCQAIDRCDPDILISTFHPDAVVDMGVFVGTPAAFAEAIIPYLKTTLVTATHRITNLLITVDGDRAAAESYMLGYAWDALTNPASPADIPDGMRYTDIWEKRNGEWRLSMRRLIMDWNACWPHSGNYTDGMYAELKYRGKRDKTDLAYSEKIAHS
jgi:ketosteroid isomerase-like protein